MGQPWTLQNSASPGSSFFRSMLAAAQTAAGLRPDAAQNAAKASSSCWAVVPRRHPTPSTPMRGTRWSASPCGVRVRAKSAASGASAFFTPAGVSPATGHGDQYRTVCPASRAPLTRLMRSGSRTAQFWALAQRSTAKRPLTSVAVVMTGTAPHAFASARASALAPPRWPDRSGTAKFPPSSTTTTAGSAALLLQWGAMARTAMPTAPTKIRAILCKMLRRPAFQGHVSAAAAHAAGQSFRQPTGQRLALCRKGQICPAHCPASVPCRNSVVKAGS